MHLLISLKMSLYTSLLFLVILLNFTYHSTQMNPLIYNDSFSLSFPLITYHVSYNSSTLEHTASLTSSPSLYRYISSFKYSIALIVSLPIGTPPQMQNMILDTGSELSWVQCGRKPPGGPSNTTPFNPTLSSSYSPIPCTNPLCDPESVYNPFVTSCLRNRYCKYSYGPYADGTYTEGILSRDIFNFSPLPVTPRFIFGCVQKLNTHNLELHQGMLGMDLGKYSFPSQYKIKKFSYCVPLHLKNLINTSVRGMFYLGENPNSNTFKYVDTLKFSSSQLERMTYFDPKFYTVALMSIMIGKKRLDIPSTAFLPNENGSFQTIIDSGATFTFLVEEAYVKVKEEIQRLVGSRLRNRTDICFEGDALQIGRMIGDVIFLFDKGVEVVINKERVLIDTSLGFPCLAIGKSRGPINIIGNVHQQNLWIEFDLVNQRVGFAKADCSRSV